MKNAITLVCRHRLPAAILSGVGVGWAMTEAINPGVGIAMGAGMALVMGQRRQDS